MSRKGTFSLGENEAFFIYKGVMKEAQFEESIFQISILNVVKNLHISLELQGAESIVEFLEIIKSSEQVGKGLLLGKFDGITYAHTKYNGKSKCLTIQERGPHSWAIVFTEDHPQEMSHKEHGGASGTSDGQRISLKTLTKMRKAGFISSGAQNRVKRGGVASVGTSPLKPRGNLRVDLDHLPSYAKESAEGLLRAIRLATEATDSVDSLSQLQLVPIDIDYIQHKKPDDGMKPTNKIPNKTMKSSEQDLLAHQSTSLFIAIGLPNLENSFPNFIFNEELTVKKTCLKDFNTKGYPAIENGFRKIWDEKLNSVNQYFPSKSSFLKSLQNIHRQTGVSRDTAFCALAYCDGSVLESLSRLMENTHLKEDISAIQRVTNIKEVLEKVLSSYASDLSSLDTSNIAVSTVSTKKLNEMSSDYDVGNNAALSPSPSASRQKEFSIELTHSSRSSQSKLQPLHRISKNANNNFDELENSSSELLVVHPYSPKNTEAVSKFRRFSNEIDYQMQGSNTMGVISRKNNMRKHEIDLWRTVNGERKSRSRK